jgi:pSer/pThr/pTyr-binding forkhead associated (FHA) protein
MEIDGPEQSTVLQLRVEFSPRPEVVFSVTVSDGVDKGASVRIDGTREVLIGQSPVCDLQLKDPTVSRRHVALEVVGRRLRVRDLASSNGTYAGRTQIIEALVDDREVLGVGESRI